MNLLVFFLIYPLGSPRKQLILRHFNNYHFVYCAVIGIRLYYLQKFY